MGNDLLEGWICVAFLGYPPDASPDLVFVWKSVLLKASPDLHVASSGTLLNTDFFWEKQHQSISFARG